ncbi:MAG: hypothetical protein GY810_17855 [Aureispira sp.]|nr:hypothetical protein [Aureispira sp.]
MLYFFEHQSEPETRIDIYIQENGARKMRLVKTFSNIRLSSVELLGDRFLVLGLGLEESSAEEYFIDYKVGKYSFDNDENLFCYDIKSSWVCRNDLEPNFNNE